MIKCHATKCNKEALYCFTDYIMDQTVTLGYSCEKHFKMLSKKYRTPLLNYNTNKNTDGNRPKK